MFITVQKTMRIFFLSLNIIQDQNILKLQLVLIQQQLIPEGGVPRR